MKKIVPILLAVALALALCLVGFADAERYDDDPLEETAVPTSEAVLEEAEPVPARSSECGACGKMSCVTIKEGTFETGPFEAKCIHSIHGTDEVYHQNATYYQVCGSCGYNTCREKAIAIYHGKAEISMCLPYLKDKAESFSDNIVRNTPNGLILLNEKLEVQQINKAALKIMNLRSPSDILGDGVVRVLDPKDFLNVLQTGRNMHDKRMYLAEYDKYVEETIIYDKEYRLLICIMRDVTQEETVREQKENISRQTVEIADKVVDKQMRIVQEIASLLGETAAETKIALSKLKESISNE